MSYMAIAPGVLMAELIMSADRMIQCAAKAEAIDGEWPPAVVLGHVSQVDEEVWLRRIGLMVEAQSAGNEAPSFVWWEPDPEATLERFRNNTVEEVGGLLMSTRTKILTTLRDLTPAQWEAIGIHATFGEISVTDLMMELLRHDEEHRATIIGAN